MTEEQALEHWLDLCDLYIAARDGGPRTAPLPEADLAERAMDEFGLEHGFKWRGLRH